VIVRVSNNFGRLDWSFSPTERRQMQQALEARLKFAAPRVVLAELTP
jgi:hypothetical protein